MPEITDIAEVTRQVEKYWSPIFRDAIRSTNLIAGLVSKDYQGIINKPGDTVRVSQIVDATGEILDVNTNADVFHPEKVQMLDIDVKVDKRFVASFEITELAQILSQLKENDSKIRASLLAGIEKQLNAFVYSKMAPKSPDNIKTTISDFNKDVMVSLRKLAGKSLWPMASAWYLLLDSDYYGDVMNAVGLTSGDYVNDQPVVSGNIGTKRFNFNIMEDTSRATQHGIAFHPDWLHLVAGEPRFKISDLHAQNRFGYVISVDFLGGAALGIKGDQLHISITN